MKNLTVTLDERTADWARLEAARRGMSVSRFVGEVLESHRGETRRYASREELHDRAGLR